MVGTSTPACAAVADLDAARARLDPVSTEDIVGWLREDRERGG